MKNRDRSYGTSGYSMLELTVVLVIVGILVTVAIVSLGSKQKPAVRELTQQLASSFSDAQQLARSTGRQVTLHVKGATPLTLTVDFEYLVPDPADPTKQITIRGGGFSMAAQGSNSSYALPGIRTDQATAASMNTTNLKGLGLVADWDAFFVNDNAVFQGAETQNLTFSNSGQISRDCYTTISSPLPGPSSPLGLVVVTRRNGIHAYFFSGEAGATWRSL